MVRNIIYFEEPGMHNTEETLRAARKRAEELGIRQVLVASSHAYTAKTAAEVFKGSGIEIIAVSISNSYSDVGWSMTAEERKEAEEAGVKVLTTLHGLADGVADAFLKDGSPGTIIADTLRCFSQGTKVAVEISIMAAEAGLIPTDREIISVAGTSDGADTALVLKPAYARKFQDLKICEIIAKPRG
jgi:hypothetical protein